MWNCCLIPYTFRCEFYRTYVNEITLNCASMQWFMNIPGKVNHSGFDTCTRIFITFIYLDWGSGWPSLYWVTHWAPRVNSLAYTYLYLPFFQGSYVQTTDGHLSWLIQAITGCVYIECMIVNKSLHNIFHVGVNDLDLNQQISWLSRNTSRDNIILWDKLRKVCSERWILTY